MVDALAQLRVVTMRSSASDEAWDRRTRSVGLTRRYVSDLLRMLGERVEASRGPMPAGGDSAVPEGWRKSVGL